MVHSNSAEQPYIKDWDQYFLDIARAVAWKSKDPKCQVGAVIVSEDQLVLATGFNGLARGVFDAEDLLQDAKEKLRWICHAETNAIFNAARTGASLKGCTIFVTKFPCLVCLRRDRAGRYQARKGDSRQAATNRVLFIPTPKS